MIKLIALLTLVCALTAHAGQVNEQNWSELVGGGAQVEATGIVRSFDDKAVKLELPDHSSVRLARSYFAKQLHSGEKATVHVPATAWNKVK